MRYRHAYADAQFPIGGGKIGGLLDVRIVVDPGGYRGKHRNCTCDTAEGTSVVHAGTYLMFTHSPGCPSHGDSSDEGL